MSINKWEKKKKKKKNKQTIKQKVIQSNTIQHTQTSYLQHKNYYTHVPYKTIFVTNMITINSNKQFEYLFMWFGLSNAPIASQHLFHNMYWDSLDQSMVCYFNIYLHLFQQASIPQDARASCYGMHVHSIYKGCTCNTWGHVTFGGVKRKSMEHGACRVVSKCTPNVALVMGSGAYFATQPQFQGSQVALNLLFIY